MNLRVNFNWKLALFVVLFLPILLRLGFWQIERANEKQQMQLEYRNLVRQPAVDVAQLPPKQWKNYQNIRAAGQFGKQQWLVDNQIYKGRFGYEVIQPLITDTGETLLVSRGWIEGSLDRTQLPVVNTPVARVNIEGYLYSPESAFALQADADTQQWPKVVQSAHVEKMYKDLAVNDKIHGSFLVRLHQGNPDLLEAHWQIINVKPEKHTAYAMQWFGMALLLLILFILASTKRKTDIPEAN